MFIGQFEHNACVGNNYSNTLFEGEKPKCQCYKKVTTILPEYKQKRDKTFQKPI